MTFKPKNKLVAWMTDDGARAFLGVTAARKQPTRWALLGEFIEEAGIGIWVTVDHVQELTSTGEPNDWKVTATWRVTQPACLIRWDFVISVQLLETYDDLKVAGFVLSKR